MREYAIMEGMMWKGRVSCRFYNAVEEIYKQLGWKFEKGGKNIDNFSNFQCYFIFVQFCSNIVFECNKGSKRIRFDLTLQIYKEIQVRIFNNLLPTFKTKSKGLIIQGWHQAIE